ncbi:hypothetical protein EI555_020275, partial [Monodon monoceros]
VPTSTQSRRFRQGSHPQDPPPSPEQARKSLRQAAVRRQSSAPRPSFSVVGLRASAPVGAEGSLVLDGRRGMAAPSMKERQACWGARDEYWKCLDENTEDASRCKKLRSSFESSCPQQW